MLDYPGIAVRRALSAVLRDRPRGSDAQLGTGAQTRLGRSGRSLAPFRTLALVVDREPRRRRCRLSGCTAEPRLGTDCRDRNRFCSGVKFGIRHLWHVLGPGLITGAADDDPSGIATYSQAGAQFGYALTWTMFLTLPFMAAIQIISACIGWGTGEGLSSNIGKRLPRPVLLALVALLVVANTINITRRFGGDGRGAAAGDRRPGSLLRDGIRRALPAWRKSPFRITAMPAI